MIPIRYIPLRRIESGRIGQKKFFEWQNTGLPGHQSLAKCKFLNFKMSDSVADWSEISEPAAVLLPAMLQAPVA
jgi:hypothetical protein